MAHTFHGGGDGLLVQDATGFYLNGGIKPLLDQTAEDFDLNLPHELGPDLPQTVVPHNVELGILLLQLAQLW